EPQRKLVTKVFSVADLVIAIPDCTLDTTRLVFPRAEQPKKPAPTAESAERLVKFVTSMVRPYSWNAFAGPGNTQDYALRTTLPPTSTPEALKEVGAVLQARRRLQDISIATEVRVLKVPAGFCEQVGVKCETNPCLTELEMGLLMRLAQERREADMTQCPKV